MRIGVLKNLRFEEIETIIERAEAIEAKQPRRRGGFGFSHLESPVAPRILRSWRQPWKPFPSLPVWKCSH